MKKLSIIFLFIILIPLNLIAKKQTIAVFNYYLAPPFFITKNSGLAHDFVSLLNQNFSDKFVFKLINIPRARLNKFLNSDYQGIVLFVNWKWMGKNSKTDYLWTDSILEDKNILISHIDNKFEFEDIRSSKNLVFGGIRGRKYNKLDVLIKENYLIRYNVDSEEQVIHMIVKNRIDITTQPYTIAKYLINKLDYEEKLFISDNPLFSFKRYIMVTHGLKDIYHELNDYIKHLNSNTKWNKTPNK